MDTASMALTSAWLQAVSRLQAPATQLAPIPAAERTMTDVIESALRHGSLDSLDPQWVDPNAPGALVDIRV
jgi:hypothetical protein